MMKESNKIKLINLEHFNKNNRVKNFANILLIYSHLQVLGIILIYKQTEYNLISPLIPQHLICEIYGHYVDGGIIISLGFLVMLIFKLYHQNFWVLVIGILNLIVYHLHAILG